jgi:hypothetical protein
MLLVTGQAEWDGGVEFQNSFGGMRGSASPFGNRLVVQSGYGCTVYMTLMGRFIYGFDNGRCGGINVNFAGLWKRVGH